MKYLLRVDETYRCDTEGEAAALIEEAKKSNDYILVKYTNTKKERKAKGEILDSWNRVVLTKSFDDEKEPCGSTTISYDTTESAF